MDNSIIADTLQLKDLLSKAEETGIIAWQIGRIAYNVKESKSFKQIRDTNYKYFKDYTKDELDKTEQTINAYIEIYKAYPNPDDIASMLVTHLRELVKIKSVRIRKIATKTFKNLQNKYILAENQQAKEKVYTTAEVKQVVNLIKNDEELSEDEIELAVTEVFRVKEEKENSKNSHKVGKPLEINEFPELRYLLEYEPVDEQGTVALFCLIFERIKKYEFDIYVNGYNERLCFDTIRFVRAKFPDASIICRKAKDARQRRELLIEFEFISSRYWEHLFAKDDCHMIICWEDNINGERIPQKKLDLLPPIFAIKDFLQSGKIKMIKKKK